MIQKTLSNPIKNLIQEKPRNIFSRLSNRAFSVLAVILDGAADLTNVFYSQETIAKRTGYSPRTVAIAVKELRDQGLISTQQRFNNSLIYRLSILFQRPDWHSELWHWFKRFPALSLSIGMLIGSPSPTRLQSSISIKIKESFLSPSYEGVSNKERVVSEAKHETVRGICLALNKKGAFLPNDECLNLFAFPQEVLEKVCLEMKNETGVKYPAAFFFGQCRKYTLELGVKPDWSRCNSLRMGRYKVLEEGEERLLKEYAEERVKKQSQFEVERKESPKREHAKTSYGVQVKRSMEEERMKAEGRKQKVLSLDEEIASWEQSIAQFKANPLQTSSSLNQVMLTMAENKLRSLVEERANLAAEKSLASESPDDRGRSQNVNPVADLRVSAKKGDGVEKDLFDSGQCSSDVETSYVQGSVV
jgi:hypothetical protein